MVYGINVYYTEFTTENCACRIYSSFKGKYKRITFWSIDKNCYQNNLMVL